MDHCPVNMICFLEKVIGQKPKETKETHCISTNSHPQKDQEENKTLVPNGRVPR